MTSRTKSELEDEIRRLNTGEHLGATEARRLQAAVDELSALTGARVTVTGQCISLDVTRGQPAQRRSARKTYCPNCKTYGTPGTPCKCPPRARAADRDIPYYDLVPVGQVTRSAPPRRMLAENRARAHGLLDNEALADPERLVALPYASIRDQALRNVEAHAQHLPPAEQDRIEALCRTRTADFDGKIFSRYIALTGSPAYIRAYEKSLRHANPAFEPDEAAAANAYRTYLAPRPTQEERAAGEGGSFALAIPWLVDPTILVQSQDNAEILSSLYGAKQIAIVTDAWHGVSSGGATLAFRGEGVVIDDADVTMAQPSVPVYTAAGDFAMSIEVSQDYPGLINEVQSMFGSAYRDMVSNYTAVGSGTSAPTGLFTAMANETTSPAHIKVSSAGSLVANDVRAVFGALPERYQLGSSWLMSSSMVQAVAALAAPSVTDGLAPHDYVPASQGQPARLLGRPVLVSSYAPSFANATSGDFSWMVCGDFSRYLVVNRIGSSLELVPTLLDFAGGTGRPTGERAYLYVARWGAAPVDNLAFRLLANS